MLNLIFPIAGDGQRFGNVFKPFIKIGDITFIEVTFQPFLKWLDKIDQIYFIFTQEQENKYKVSQTLESIFILNNINYIIIPEKTFGPYQTIKSALKIRKINGSTIICDCDHKVDVDIIFEKMDFDDFDVIIPTWNINLIDYENWSKLLIINNKISKIVEKDTCIDESFLVKGIIGCIGFKSLDGAFSNDGVYISDYLTELIYNNKNIIFYDARYAYFYGTPKMLNDYVNYLREIYSIFCDVDGILIEHSPHSTDDIDNNLIILDNINQLHKWKENGHRIILSTARNFKYKESFIKLLRHYNIPFDDLVMGLTPGPRILINDKKPSHFFVNQAIAINTERNSILEKVDFEKNFLWKNLKVLQKFSGNSFAKTFLMDNEGNKFVRKIVNKIHIIHYLKLKRQFQDLQRFDFMFFGSVPKTIREEESVEEYLIDIEYLENYKLLSDADLHKQSEILNDLFNKLKQHIYVYKKCVNGKKWFESFMQRKIFPKLFAYASDPILNTIINSNIFINGKKYFGLRETLMRVTNKSLLFPDYIMPIHGDLTLENIMFLNDDFKVFDMDGADFFDAAELDLGKICQSVFSNYKQWQYLENPIKKINGNFFECEEEYFKINNSFLTSTIINCWKNILNNSEEIVINKGILYMSTYFIRFVSFRQQISKEHGIFALLMANVWLSKILEVRYEKIL